MLEVAGIGEIHLGGQQGGAGDAVILHRRHPGQRHGQKGAAHAIAHGRDLPLPGGLLDGVEGGENALVHIVLEALLRLPLVRIDPGHDEDREPLGHRPAHEALLGVEVEHIELVDPGWHDQQGALVDGGRRRRVLDQLEQVAAKHHLARGRGHVDAQLEFGGIALADLQLALASLHILREHLHPPHQILAALADGVADQFGIGGDEIGGRDRASDLAQVELGALAGGGVHAVGMVDQFVGPVVGERIGLAQEIEDRILLPLGIHEPLVAGVSGDHVGGVFAAHAPQGVRPQVDEAGGDGCLGLQAALGVGEPVFGHLAEGLHRIAHAVGEVRIGAAFLHGLHIGGESLAADLDQPRRIAREGLEIGQWRSLGAGGSGRGRLGQRRVGQGDGQGRRRGRLLRARRL